MIAVASKTDFVLISQGYDDHAHGPTLTKLSGCVPSMKYICPPSAKSILTSCGIREQFITIIRPGPHYSPDTSRILIMHMYLRLNTHTYIHTYKHTYILSTVTLL